MLVWVNNLRGFYNWLWFFLWLKKLVNDCRMIVFRIIILIILYKK